jgi:hypothetical protein
LDPEDVDTLAKESAQRLWGDDETFKPVEKVAEWLGGRYVPSGKSTELFGSDE